MTQQTIFIICSITTAAGFLCLIVVALNEWHIRKISRRLRQQCGASGPWTITTGRRCELPRNHRGPHMLTIASGWYRAEMAPSPRHRFFKREKTREKK